MNKTRFRINQDVATTIKNRWRNLDKPKPDEEIEEYKKRVRAFEKYDRTAHDVMQHLGLLPRVSSTSPTNTTNAAGPICQGYVVNYQATAWNKAVIELANQEDRGMNGPRITIEILSLTNPEQATAWPRQR